MKKVITLIGAAALVLCCINIGHTAGTETSTIAVTVTVLEYVSVSTNRPTWLIENVYAGECWLAGNMYVYNDGTVEEDISVKCDAATSSTNWDLGTSTTPGEDTFSFNAHTQAAIAGVVTVRDIWVTTDYLLLNDEGPVPYGEKLTLAPKFCSPTSITAYDDTNGETFTVTFLAELPTP